MRTRYRQALTRNQAPSPGTSPAQTGRRAAGKRRTAARPGCRQRARPRAAGTAGAGEDHGHYLAQRRLRWPGAAYRHAGRLPPGDPVVRVFAYQADPGQPAEEIAEEAFAIFNDHPRDAAGAELACAYYGRRLRSLSFPGNRPCCGRSCCLHRRAVLA